MRRLLKLTVIPCLLLLNGCVSSGDDPQSDNGELCDGQQIETYTEVNENREGEYLTTRDVITGECQTPAEQLKRGFEVSIDDSGNTIDMTIAAGVLGLSESLITLADGGKALRWLDSFESLYRNASYTNNEKSFYTGDIELEIEFLITEEGYFRATTISDDDASHLAIFGAANGQLNYLGFNGAHLRTTEYNVTGARSRYNSNIKQANILAHMLSNTYADLALENAMSNPLRNHAELFDLSPTVIKSFFSRNVFVMRSFIYHNRMDYDDLGLLEMEPISTWNKLWSPLGDDERDPAETLMSRSYNVNYEDGANSNSLTYLETWSGSHELDSKTSIQATGHYGGDLDVDYSTVEPGSRFAIQCSAASSGCTLSTSRNAGVAAFVKGFAPTRVEMEINNVWALGHTAVVTANFSDWDTFDRTESPLRLNPNPLAAVVERRDR